MCHIPKAAAVPTTLNSCSRVFSPNNASIRNKKLLDSSIGKMWVRAGTEVPVPAGCSMRFEDFAFGRIRVDGTVYDHDLVIDHGKIHKRKKKASKKYRDAFGHTPLSVDEEIPWNCSQLIIGTGMGALPVMSEVKLEAGRRKIELLILPTAKAIEVLNKQPEDTNAILHVTC